MMEVNDLSRSQLIGKLSTLNQDFETLEETDKKKQRQDFAVARSNSFSTSSKVEIVVAFIVLAFTLLACIFTSQWNIAAVGGALGFFLFLSAVIQDTRYKEAQRAVPKLAQSYKQSQESLSDFSEEFNQLESELPTGYKSHFAVQNMLRALLTGLATTPEDAKEYQDICQKRFDEEQQELKYLNQLTSLADQAESDYEAAKLALGMIETKISQLQNDATRLDEENQVLLVHINDYGKE
ncbi:hypothetical protein [Bifidobacterium sp. ESL0745]|uniref:hypothetical protein n=1 Tax=Bifidobacterium sp. ESL0745 TaxID=2983226 RepID=UPI0023F826DC|nr:hypothetical protein [Bifidobacterium sp. ESL0745]MDF7665259.1 hypothetical protein [Bifidobacterium sp. ESL0745]